MRKLLFGLLLVASLFQVTGCYHAIPGYGIVAEAEEEHCEHECRDACSR